jgi:hypothetical protein
MADGRAATRRRAPIPAIPFVAKSFGRSANSLVRPMSHAIQAHPLPSSSVPDVPPRTASRHGLPRHELHRAVDGDWEAGGLDRSEARGSAAASLAALAGLPVVSLLLEALPHAPSWIVAAVATLPLGALLLVAITWRAGGGRS